MTLDDWIVLDKLAIHDFNVTMAELMKDTPIEKLVERNTWREHAVIRLHRRRNRLFDQLSIEDLRKVNDDQLMGVHNNKRVWSIRDVDIDIDYNPFARAYPK